MLRKRLLALMLALATVFALCACGQTADESELPEEFLGRKLGDEELLTLRPEDPEAMRAAISTVEDAAAWFALQGQKEYPESSEVVPFDLMEYRVVLPVPEQLRGHTGDSFGVDTVSMISAWLLQDDYPGTCVLTELSTFSHPKMLLCFPAEGGGYHLINVVKLIPGQNKGAPRYQFAEELSGELAGLSDSADAERALISDLYRGVAFYRQQNGQLCAFMDRRRITMLRSLAPEKLAMLPGEQETAPAFRMIYQMCGVVYEGVDASEMLAEYGMRRLDDSERSALLGGRRLSDAELAALSPGDLDALRTALSTPEDVAAWFKLQDFEYWDSAAVSYSNSAVRFEYPAVSFLLSPEGLKDQEENKIETYIGRDSINILAAWLLQDDFNDCGALLVLMPQTIYGYLPYSAVCVRLDGEYVLFNMAAMIDMVTMSGCVAPEELLDGMAVSDLGRLSEYIDDRTEGDQVRHGEIGLIRDLEHPIGYVSYGPNALFEDRSGVLCAQQAEQTVEEYMLEQGSYEKKWAFLDFDIAGFHVPDALGGCRLSDAEVEALVGQDVDLVAEKVNTVADLIRYLHAGSFTFGGGGDIWQDDAEDDDLAWHFNKTARTANMTRDIDCGATANLVRALLDGDYPEVGIVAHTYRNGEGGGHIYNYIRAGKHFYVFDMTMLTGGHFDPDVRWCCELEELADYANEYKSMGYEYLPVIYAYDAEPDIPVGWGKGEDGCSVSWLPTGSQIRIIAEDRQAGYSVEYRDLPADTAAGIAHARTDGMANRDYFRVDAFPGVEAYGFPAAFGEATLSYDEMLQLVWTADMETLAAKIRTVPDLMMFFHAAGYHGNSTGETGGGSDITAETAGNVIWHFNEYAERTRYQSAHGCGQCAATVRYMLDGDYEEVGYLSCTWAEGMGGGHNFNYIKADGVYYALDMNLYDMSEYAPSTKGFIRIGSDLSDFRNCYGAMYDGMMCCYASPLLREIPVGWERNDVKTSWLPEQYENEIRVLWTTEDEGYTYRFCPLSAEWEAYMDRFRAA